MSHVDEELTIAVGGEMKLEQVLLFLLAEMVKRRTFDTY